MAKEKKELTAMTIPLPQGVSAQASGPVLTVKGEKGEVARRLPNPMVKIAVDASSVVLTPLRSTKREKKIIGTFRAHVNGMIKGVSEGHNYKLKVCSGHFPMNVAMSGSELVVKNFFGEKVPRKLSIPASVKVQVQGQDITVSSPDKEAAGKVALSIENLTKRTAFDRRIFQDGLYIVEKA